MANGPEFDSLLEQARKCFHKSDHKQAFRLFGEALEHSPDAIEAHEGMATASFLMKDYEGAIKHFKRMTLIKPQDPRPYINLGAVYNRLGDYKQAVDILQRGLQRNRKSSEGYYNLGIAQKNLNQLSMASTAYREAIRLNPDMAEAHQNLANVYLEMKNNKKAIEHFKKAIAIKPEFERAIRGLACAQEAIDKYKAEEKPFGRLVDEQEYASKQLVATSRVLSETERIGDRQQVEIMTLGVLTTTSEFFTHSRDVLEPSLTALSRGVAQGSDGVSQVFEDHERFRAALNRWNRLREQLAESMSAMTRHEDSMKG